jgi:hypothetical protein
MTAQAIGTVAFAAAVLGGMASGVVAIVNMFRTVAYRKDGVPLFPHWYVSPFNVVFRPDQLTDRGLAARRRGLWVSRVRVVLDRRNGHWD